ncbi:hypothetical protein H2204_004606 [Knufia peltigerae]|uniref:FHA domain-containing protein n=1 Tax=Knufia peltigerae TaxID=1002370 RepID=A0AA38Y7D6_9EURO|nr:hypothetical protein H2204_004606 [Knufia peltigerae]
MASTDGSGYVILHVHDLCSDGPLFERFVVLRSPDWVVKIGRGSMNSEEDLQPSKTNTTFDSRVMSRNHAKISANPQTKEIFVTDIGSMHGTHLSGRRLKTEEPALLSPEDIITLGIDVSRGSSSFEPVKVCVNWIWYDDGVESLNDNPPSAQPGRNSFSAEYSDEDAYADDVDSQDIEDYQVYAKSDQDVLVPGDAYPEEQEDALGADKEEIAAVNVVEDSCRSPSIEVVVPASRTFTVPDSDISISDADADSYVSSNEESNVDSPTSSPVSAAQFVEGKENAVQHTDTAADISLQTEAEIPAAPVCSKTTPADVMWSSVYLNSGQKEIDNVDHHSSPLPLETGRSDIRAVRSTLAELPETTHLDTLGLPQDRVQAHRAPSPSDAAMAKSSATEMPLAPPFIQTSDAIQGMSQRPDHQQTRSTSAWAGHNSVLYDYGAGPQGACTKGYPSYYHEWTGRSPPDPLTLPPLDLHKVAPATEPLSTAEGTHVVKVKQSNKRKADHISSDDLSVHTANEYSHFWETIKDNLSPVNDAETDVRAQSPPSSSLADIPVQSTEVDDQPAYKKIRTDVDGIAESRGNSTGDAMKLAVATIAGVAIGAIGTVIGLAALPPIS